MSARTIYVKLTHFEFRGAMRAYHDMICIVRSSVNGLLSDMKRVEGAAR